MASKNCAYCAFVTSVESMQNAVPTTLTGVGPALPGHFVSLGASFGPSLDASGVRSAPPSRASGSENVHETRAVAAMDDKPARRRGARRAWAMQLESTRLSHDG